jgi:hypothetical protein
LGQSGHDLVGGSGLATAQLRVAVQVAAELHQLGFDVLRQTIDLVMEGSAGLDG